MEGGRVAFAFPLIAAPQAEEAFAWGREISSLWDDTLEILVTPTCAVPPPQIGHLAPDQDAAILMGRLSETTLFTIPFDVTGQPAISLPLHWNAAGLPIGVQLVAAVGREDLLFRVAAQIEGAQPWFDRLPTL